MTCRFLIGAGLAVAGGCLVVSACGAEAPGAIPAMPAANTMRATAGSAVRVVAKPVPAKPLPVPSVSVSRMTAGDGSLVTVATFSGPVRYALYDGSSDPYVRPGVLRDQTAVAGAARSHLLAAFNGGFKMVAYAGGYQQEGHVLYPLRDGLASLIISRAGQAHIGVWPHADQDKDAYSVRQNLPPLVLDGKPTTASYDWGLWGATLGGGEYVARSALGQAADGDLMYAGSMSASPYDLARTLAEHGARTAMELDINPAWVQLDVARHPGGALHASVYGQYRPADQYLYGWTRDFVAVLGALSGWAPGSADRPGERAWAPLADGRTRTDAVACAAGGDAGMASRPAPGRSCGGSGLPACAERSGRPSASSAASAGHAALGPAPTAQPLTAQSRQLGREPYSATPLQRGRPVRPATGPWTGGRCEDSRPTACVHTSTELCRQACRRDEGYCVDSST